jgi:hypothetical protein
MKLPVLMSAPVSMFRKVTTSVKGARNRETPAAAGQLGVNVVIENSWVGTPPVTKPV